MISLLMLSAAGLLFCEPIQTGRYLPRVADEPPRLVIAPSIRVPQMPMMLESMIHTKQDLLMLKLCCSKLRMKLLIWMQWQPPRTIVCYKRERAGLR